MFDPLIPDSEQQTAIDKALRPESQNAMALAAEVGVGKTLVAVEVGKRLGAKVWLIVAPLQTLGVEGDEDNDPDGWMGSVQQQRVGLPFKQITNTISGRKNLADYGWGVPGVYFVGHEYFTLKAWTKEPIILKNGKPRLDKKGNQMFRHVKTSTWSSVTPDIMIFDEVHRAQSHESWTFKALMLTTARFKIGASGTFTGNSFDGAYAITKWLWPHLAEKNIYDWRHRWAETIYDPFAVHNEKTVGEREPGAFFGSLPCYVMIESKLDVNLEVEDVWVDLYPEQRRVYQELDGKMVAWIEDNPLVVKVPPTKRMRQRQATLAMPQIETVWVEKTQESKVEVSFAEDAQSAKFDKLVSILRKEIGGEPLVIFTDSKKFAQDVLVPRLNGEFGEGTARAWTGDVKKEVRRQNKLDFLQGKFQIIVGVQKAMGTGTDKLQTVCRYGVLMSSDESRIENEQGYGRLFRRGQLRDVKFWRILAKNTIDSGQLSSQAQAALKMNAILRKKARK